MSGPHGGVVYSGVQTFPSMATYFEYDTLTNPSLNRFIWDIANANGNTHDLIFRVNSTTDLLKLNGNSATFAKSILPSADNTITLGASGARFSAIWAANGTIQTSDVRDKEISTRIPGATAAAAIDAIAPVMFRWKIGSNDVIEQFVHNVVPPDAGGDFDYEAARSTGQREIVGRPGNRLHAGFIAQEIKAVMDAAEVDFGVWGLENPTDPDSRQWLRPDQLIPVLWAALRETRAEMAALKAGLARSQ